MQTITRIQLITVMIVMSALFISMILPQVNASSNSYFVEWASNNSDASGLMTITCPNVIESNKTYEIALTINLNHVNGQYNVEFSNIEWQLELQGGGSVILGHSSTDSISIHGSASTISHWVLPSQATNGTGNLVMNVTLLFHSELDPNTIIQTSVFTYSPNITLYIKQKLGINLTASSPSNLSKGDTISIGGQLSEPQINALINITYVKPNGDSVQHWVITDQNGSFTDSLSADSEGVWQVQASWPGNETMSSDASKMLLFSVGGPNVLILIVSILAVGLFLTIPPFIGKIRRFTNFGNQTTEST